MSNIRERYAWAAGFAALIGAAALAVWVPTARRHDGRTLTWRTLAWAVVLAVPLTIPVFYSVVALAEAVTG
jgi:hypothetical protein